MYTDDLKGYTGGDRCSPPGRVLFTVHGGVGGSQQGEGGTVGCKGGVGGRGVGGCYQTNSLCWDSSHRERAIDKAAEFIFFFFVHQDDIKCTEKTIKQNGGL